MRILPLALCGALLLAASASSVEARDKKKKAKKNQQAAATRTFSIATTDGIAYVGQTGGLAIRDVSDPERPVDLSWFSLPASVSDVLIDGSHAYLASGNRGLVILDVADPEQPKEVARLDTDGKVKRLARVGGFMFAADGANGLLVVDVSTIETPRTVTRITTRGDVRSVAVQGEWLAIAEGHGGARVFDIRRPDNPRESKRLDARFSARDVCWIEDRLYIAAGNLGTALYEPALSTRPLSFLAPVRSAQHVACDGHLVAVSNLGSAIQLFDVSESGPGEERSRLRVHRTAPIGQPRFEGSRLWVAVDIAGMGLLDVTDPGEPQRVLPRRREFKVSF